MQRLWRFVREYRRKTEVLCGFLLFIMAINLVSVAARKSSTADELVLIPAAYYHVVAGQFDLVYEHPPLCKLLAAIPLLFLQPNEMKPEQLQPEMSPGDRAWAYLGSFWRDNRERLESLAFWPRLPMIALTLGLGLLVFAFTRELFGRGAALCALFLFTVEPTVLAHGRIVQTDIAAAFGFLLVFYTTYRYAAQPGTRRAIWVGVAAGIALLAKYSMLLVCPILLVLFAVGLWQRRRAILPHAIIVGLTTLLVVNAAYFFRHRPVTQADIDFFQKPYGSALDVIIPVTRVLTRIIPTEFVLGVLWQLAHSSDGHHAGLLGMHSKTGWWYYFPVAFALKTTLPFFFLSISALVWGCWRVAATRDARFLWLLLPFLIYSVFLLFTGINIGVRYYLPGYMFLFVLGGAALACLTNARRAAGFLVTALVLGWCAVSAMQVYPDYLSYMNAFASRHPRWWYLSDSNIEWGDDVRGLANYLHAHGETDVRAALLAGYMTLQYYGINYVDMLSEESLPATRYVALGASFLNGSTVPESQCRSEAERVNRFDEFRRRVPEAIIGGSIYVFRMHD
ncbi:MAG TPA: glycosyltransferase family 39 protein [Chthoniobacterales bacterium]|nr:glycosyltransferase family 39 protein [Chthoniobacterales bacterium]